jgi:surface antigen
MYAVKPSDQEAHVVRGYRNALGQDCQVVEQSVFIAGQLVRATGTVCRQPDGRWALTR